MRSSWGASPVPRRTRVPRCTSSLSSPAIELLDDQRHRGVWVDRTALFAAKNRNEEVTEADFTSPEDLELASLPAWSHLSAEQRHRRMAEMIEDIERETLERHQREGTAPAGGEEVRRRQPHERPNRVAKSVRPRFHAATETVRSMLLAGYREFVLAYREAAALLKAGDVTARFPENCFPSRLPFVPPLDFGFS